MHSDLRRLLILLAACAPLTPGMAHAGSASAGASATVLPMAVAEAPILVDVRSAGSNGNVVVSATPAAARNDGASVSATLASGEQSTPLATVASGAASASVPGLVGQRLAIVLSQAETNTPGKLQLTINYN